MKTENYLREFYFIFFAQRKIIGWTTGLFFVASLLIAFFWPPTFSAKGSILVRAKKMERPPEALEEIDKRLFSVTKEDLASEAQIMTSPDVVDHTIKHLQKNNRYEKNVNPNYTRSGNPTRAALEEAIALLEGGQGATCTATGMSAVVVALNLLPHGSHLLCTVDCYGGTFRALEHARVAYGLEVTYLDLADLGAVKATFRPNTRMVWIETPSNPLLRLTDIRAVSDLARARGALSVVDNTFLSPVLQRPFDHGADLVVHSTTKYLNGHSDVVGGAVVARRGQVAMLQRIQGMNNLLGTSQSPHDCFLVLRGLKTLHAAWSGTPRTPCAWPTTSRATRSRLR